MLFAASPAISAVVADRVSRGNSLGKLHALERHIVEKLIFLDGTADRCAVLLDRQGVRFRVGWRIKWVPRIQHARLAHGEGRAVNGVGSRLKAHVGRYARLPAVFRLVLKGDTEFLNGVRRHHARSISRVAIRIDDAPGGSHAAAEDAFEQPIVAVRTQAVARVAVGPAARAGDDAGLKLQQRLVTAANNRQTR